MTVCWENLQHAKEFQKQAQNKGVKSKSYAPGNKVWLNIKYIKTKQNRKLEVKFFEPFWVLNPIGKQAYKLKPLKKWRIHNGFHILLLEQNTIKRERVEKVPKLDAGNEIEEYKVEAIWDSTVYANKSESGHLPGLYYLVAWKGYSKEENTWEPSSTFQHLKKLISFFHKDYLEKPTATSPPIDSAFAMARLTVKPSAKATTK